MAEYDLQRFVADVSKLTLGAWYKYVSGKSSCKVVSIDATTGAIVSKRHGSVKVSRISSAMVAKLLPHLNARHPVNLETVFEGGGNVRSVLEALLANTENIFVCHVSRHKCIFWDPTKSHPIGQIVTSEPPTASFVSTAPSGIKADDFNLKIGDQNADGSITVLDSDDLCYRVYSKSNSKTGIRTISKDLFAEWVPEVAANPSASAFALRKKLRGKTEIDKFEYGYCATLFKMALMSLGLDPVHTVDVSKYTKNHSKAISSQAQDVFVVALKLFKGQRTTWTSSFIGEGAVYASVNTEVRNYFGDAANWNVETLAGAEAFKEFCIKHTWMLKNGNGAWASLSTYTDEHRKALLEWIDSRIVKQEKPLSEVVVDDNGFKGLTNKAVTELLMKFHPGQYCLCNGPTLEALKTLKLIDGGVSEKFAYNDYMQVMGACANVLARLKSANIHATAGGPDNPDYIVVNEFLYFVSENFKEIKDEVIKMAAKPAERNPYDKTKGKKKSFNADSKEDQLMLRILASLRTKPFVILAGHSGTGKSRMVKKLAYMTCRDNKLHEGSDPGNYCIIEVKPNWHDSTELLGYFSSFGHDHYVTKQLVEFIMKAYAYPDVPFFVCLDEMNLAPVEQYFAEFLSALEDIHMDEGKKNEFFGLNAANKPDGSAAQEVVKYTSAPLIKPIDYKDDIAMLEPKTTQAMDWLKTHGLTIPKNLFVVGTVNMDESTNQFSRKVLDRAFTIEMTDARFEDFGDEDKDPMPTFAKEDEIDHALIDNLLTGKKQAGKLSTRDADDTKPKGQLENMNDLKGVLAGTPFVVAYRFANEYALYEDALNVLDVLADGASETDKVAKKAANAKRAFDDAVLMKLLPRIAGERAVVAEIFEGRKTTDKRGEKDGLLKFLEYDKEQKKGTASGEKMTEILNRGNVPYLTFWP